MAAEDQWRYFKQQSAPQNERALLKTVLMLRGRTEQKNPLDFGNNFRDCSMIYFFHSVEPNPL
jgi:hypothetical protein